MRRALFLLCSVPVLAAAQSGLAGVVLDAQGTPMPQVRVGLRTAAGAAVGRAVTDEQGRYVFASGAPGMWLIAEKDGFARVEKRASGADVIMLAPLALSTSVTVTARAGALEEARDAAPLVWQRQRGDEAARSAPTVGHILEEAPGILVQQTTPGQVSPFLRGLTGYHVAHLVDGVRFNNSTFRSGPNQYLAFFEPSQAERIEAMLGPSGTQYGSDGLGGVIQLLTPAAEFRASDRWQWHGFAQAGGETADWSSAGQAEVSAGRGPLWLLGGVHGARHQDLRAGGGLDSHHVFRRLLGLDLERIRDLTGSRLQDTAWSRAGAYGKAAWRIGTRDLITGWYQRSAILGVRGYKDLWGGLGRLQSAFRPQQLDFGYARWERFGGFFDSVSARASWNRMLDGSVRQGLRAGDVVVQDENEARMLGWQGQALRRAGRHSSLGVQGEWYGERISASRLQGLNPARPLYPDGSAYRTAAVAAHGSTELLSRRVRLGYGARWSDVRFRAEESARFGVPSASLRFSQWTWNGSAVWRAARGWGLQGAAGLGFRAPNLNDLGAIGLNDLGYEIPVRDALPWQPLLADNASEAALPKGVLARALVPETLRNVEAGWQGAWSRFEARVQGFAARLRDPIVRRTLLFDAARVPDSLGGIPVRPLPQTPQQAAQGVVTVATPFDSRAVKAFVNDGRTDYRGLESLFRWRMSSRWSARGAYSFIAGNDLDPHRPVRRLPPQSGHLAVRRDSGRRWWAEAGLLAAGAQRRLSGGDLDDERIGAARSRNDIRAFLAGARVGEFLDPQGRFRPTGESVEQVVARVLPPGLGISDSQRVPLYMATPGWARFDLRGGWNAGEFWVISAGISNLFDRNFRVHGSGVDAPGRSFLLQVVRRW